MTGKPRPPSQSRFATTVIEETSGPVRDGGMLVAPPVARKPTPVAMPAPPSTERGSHDDIERVLEIERTERERALLLAKLQDAEQEKQQAIAEAQAARAEAEQLRMPTVAFPPASIPPPPGKKIESDAAPVDIKELEKLVVKSRIGRAAVTVGIALALAWNAFNSARVGEPAQKIDAVQARQHQNEQLTSKELEAQALERERNTRRWRAVYCWAKQMRGATQRQGLDLPSLPPGGIKALRLGDEDPNRPGPPRFVAEEKCPDFPPLPPDMASP